MRIQKIVFIAVAGVLLVLGSGPSAWAQLAIPANTLTVGADSDNNEANSAVLFTVDNAEKMRLTAAGYLGIGTANPAGALHVVGKVFLLDGTKVPSGAPSIFVGQTNATSANDSVALVVLGQNSARLVVMGNGNVGIGTVNPGAYKLAVKGKIHAEEVVVDTGWADFVFNKDYKLMPLEKVARHISDNGHLPGIPTAQEVKENGVSIGQMQSKLLEKIEEMTLYVIDLKKENDQLKERISSLENTSL